MSDNLPPLQTPVIVTMDDGVEFRAMRIIVSDLDRWSLLGKQRRGESKPPAGGLEGNLTEGNHMRCVVIEQGDDFEAIEVVAESGEWIIGVDVDRGDARPVAFKAEQIVADGLTDTQASQLQSDLSSEQWSYIEDGEVGDPELDAMAAEIEAIEERVLARREMLFEARKAELIAAAKTAPAVEQAA